MINYHSLKRKLYYYVCNKRLRYTDVQLSDKLKRMKNIFIYFDYEREFGNSCSDLKDKNIDEILTFLDEKKIKTTWFTVGKIFDTYPESVKKIHKFGHEVASHTYSHKSPYSLSKKNLISDFSDFKEANNIGIDLKGFHAPRGLWSMGQIKLLTKFNYKYDIANDGSENKSPKRIMYKDSEILRFKNYTDDWKLYTNKYNEKEADDIWTNMVEHIKIGEIVGFGFHPWVLFKNDKIFDFFKSFIEYLLKLEDVQIDSIENYLKEIKK